MEVEREEGGTKDGVEEGRGSGEGKRREGRRRRRKGGVVVLSDHWNNVISLFADAEAPSWNQLRLCKLSSSLLTSS